MYIFRADGNAKIGVGHLMRCMTIAEALAELLGGRDEIVFVCADEQSAQMAEQNGWNAQALHTDYREMDSEKAFIDTVGTDNVLLVDSYYVTDAYLECLQRQGKVFLLDDMQRHAFPVDGVINYNLFAEEERYSEMYRNRKSCLCIGGSYVPVRTQFLRKDYQVKNKVQNVMITTGGGDCDNIAGQILKTIDEDKLNYHLIIGKFNPHFEELLQLSKTRKNLFIHYDVKDMASLMADCDIAVTAGGTTIYELASIGVPLICFSYAENQELLTEYIGKHGIAGYAGAYHRHPEETLQAIKQIFSRMCADYKLRNECYLKEKEVIDGQGAKRIAQKLLENHI